METKFYIYIILLYFLSSTQCLSKRRYCKKNNKKIDEDNNALTVTKEEEKKESCIFYDPGESDNHLPAQKCSFGLEINKKIINPYENFKNNYGVYSFKSACLKCAACLAIAENINQTFTDFYYEHSVELLTIKNFECQVLNNLCLDGFKNYDLREYNGKRLITKASIYSKHINTKMDGNWTKVLRDLCKRYVQHMDVYDAFQRFKSGNINFTNYICKGDGIFRDCNNIDLKQIEMPQAEGDFNVNVCVNCS